MANTFTLKSKTYDGRYMQLTCTQTIDIASNTSTIDWTLKTIGGNDNYYSTGATTLIIDGQKAYYKARTAYTTKIFPAAKGSTSGSVQIAHNNDGSKAISVSFSTAIYTSAISTYSDIWTLDTIPRGASLNSATDFTDEDTDKPTITYTNNSGENATTLEAYIYAEDGATVLVGAKSLSKTGNSYTYTFTDEERKALRAAAKNANSITVKFGIKSVVSGNPFTSNLISKTLTIVNANPTANITAYDNNTVTTALTGSNQTIIKGYSNIYYLINATALKEATIASYQVENGNITYYQRTNTFTGATGQALSYKITDSRNNSYLGTHNFKLINYIPVTCNQKVEIVLEGETGVNVLLSLSGNYFNGSFGKVQNALSLFYRLAEDGGVFGEWQQISSSISENSYTATHTITGLDYSKSYIVQCMARDALESAESSPYTAKLTPVFDWSETDFNFNCEVKIKNKSLIDIVYPVGSIYMSVNNISPQGFFGGSWE